MGQYPGSRSSLAIRELDRRSDIHPYPSLLARLVRAMRALLHFDRLHQREHRLARAVLLLHLSDLMKHQWTRLEISRLDPGRLDCRGVCMLCQWRVEPVPEDPLQRNRRKKEMARNSDSREYDGSSGGDDVVDSV